MVSKDILTPSDVQAGLSVLRASLKLSVRQTVTSPCTLAHLLCVSVQSVSVYPLNPFMSVLILRVSLSTERAFLLPLHVRLWTLRRFLYTPGVSSWPLQLFL